MKKVLAWFLVLALTAAVSIGATLAYLMDTDEDVNVMTLGNVKIDQLEYERIDTETTNEDAQVQGFHDNKPLLPAVTEEGFTYVPGDTYVDWDQIGKDGYTSTIWDPTKINNEVDKMVFVKNKGKSDAFVRTVFAFEAGNYETLDQFQSMVHLNLNETDWTWEWMQDTPVTIGESKYFIATATYNKVLEPGKLTEISLSQVAQDKTATNEDVEAFGDTYQILVKSQAIQTAGFDAAATALDEGFGEITGSNIPWENDSPITGATVFNAVHYLNADPAGTDIKTKVASITFGLTKDHAAVADDYTGTLVDVEQDVPVYAYYVPSGSNYDVYLLASDTIYAPTDCTNLCNGMSNLQTVDTSNLDVSRTKNMQAMFRDCAALQSIDVSEWDTSNVTKMNNMFRGCKSLTYVDVSDWDVGNVETMLAIFQDCLLMETIEVGDWDVSSVTSMIQMFNRCKALSTLDVSRWDMSNVTTTYLMFQDCNVLSKLDTADWDTGSLTTAFGMFNHCWALKDLDVSGWDVSNVTDMAQMFCECKALASLDLSNWNVGKVTTTRMMFNYCTSLKELKVSGWKPSSLTTMEGMFNHCEVLEELDVSGWDTGNVTNMGTVFQQCWALKTLDVSNWNTSKVTAMGWMFYNCGALTELNVSKWDVSKVTIMSHMFRGCTNLLTMPVDDWDVSSVETMDALFHSCQSLTTINLSKWNTVKVREFSQMFEGDKNLVEIIGLGTLNTTSAKVFDEMFWGCTSLKVLDMSGWDTSGVTPGYKHHNGDYTKGFSNSFTNMPAVEKLILGENFCFAGNGKVEAQYQPKLPDPAGEGTKWYNAETGTYYDATEIPEKIAATYVAAVPPVNP